MARITIIDYGAGNLASLRNAFEFLDIPVEITSEIDHIRSADKLLLPGVGAFAPAIRRLEERGIASTIQQKVYEGTPLLGICLGMQLLFTTSYEQGEWSGLDLIPGEVTKFTGGKKVPHMGWNKLDIRKPDGILKGIAEPAFVYFVHSYYCVPSEPEVITATSEYGTSFCATVRKDNIWGAQFHPEKSQDVGLQILKNFATQE